MPNAIEQAQENVKKTDEEVKAARGILSKAINDLDKKMANMKVEKPRVGLSNDENYPERLKKGVGKLVEYNKDAIGKSTYSSLDTTTLMTEHYNEALTNLGRSRHQGLISEKSDRNEIAPALALVGKALTNVLKAERNYLEARSEEAKVIFEGEPKSVKGKTDYFQGEATKRDRYVSSIEENQTALLERKIPSNNFRSG